MSMKKRILLTGATGLIGRQALELLLDRRYEVHAVTSRGKIPAEQEPLATTWHHLDLLEDGSCQTVIERVKPDGLLHLAWAVAPGNFNDDVHRKWLEASRSLIRHFYEPRGRACRNRGHLLRVPTGLRERVPRSERR